VRARLIAEAANGPTTPAADREGAEVLVGQGVIRVEGDGLHVHRLFLLHRAGSQRGRPESSDLGAMKLKVSDSGARIGQDTFADPIAGR
jgi:hypothetical protein